MITVLPPGGLRSGIYEAQDFWCQQAKLAKENLKRTFSSSLGSLSPMDGLHVPQRS